MGTGEERARASRLAIPALLLCALWTASYEVAPFAHALEHAVHLEHSHSYADHVDPAHDGPDPEHGEGSTAHRDVAASTPPPAIPPIDPPLVALVRIERARDALSSSAPVRDRRARGPPASAS